MSYRSCSGLKGVEILNEMDAIVEEIIAVLYDKLHSDPVTPGMYDVITAPDVTGVIAHEAFGHGVEMDMFVKDRARQRVYRQACCLPALLHARRSSRRTAGQQLSF